MPIRVPVHSKAKVTPQFVPTVDSQKLHGTTYVISCYYNPVGYETRLDNCRIFYNHLTRVTDNIIIIEVGKEPALYKFIDDKHVRFIQSEPQTWIKEQCYNIALELLPKDCDKVITMDCDVFFDSRNWLHNTEKALQEYKVVQPYIRALRMPKGIIHPSKAKVIAIEKEANLWAIGLMYMIMEHQNQSLTTGWGHPGYVLAFRRSVLDTHKFFDKCVIGAGDWYLMNAILDMDMIKGTEVYGIPFMIEYLRWAQPLNENVGNSITFVNHSVFHLYHGTLKNRQHKTRIKKFHALDFDPKNDLEKNNESFYVLTRPELREWTKQFFVGRKEDE